MSSNGPARWAWCSRGPAWFRRSTSSRTWRCRCSSPESTNRRRSSGPLAALDRLELGGLAGALPEALSGGQAQRVAVARVLAGRPALVLADEPTGQLDRENADHVVEVLVAAVDELGAALVVSTHDEAVAARLDTRWEMADGVLRRAAGR